MAEPETLFEPERTEIPRLAIVQRYLRVPNNGSVGIAVPSGHDQSGGSVDAAECKPVAIS